MCLRVELLGAVSMTTILDFSGRQGPTDTRKFSNAKEMRRFTVGYKPRGGVSKHGLLVGGAGGVYVIYSSKHPTTNHIKIIIDKQTLHDIIHSHQIRADNLEFISEEISYHSIHSEATITIFMKCIYTYMIILQGDWSSGKFLSYIQKQVILFKMGEQCNAGQEHIRIFIIPDCE